MKGSPKCFRTKTHAIFTQK